MDTAKATATSYRGDAALDAMLTTAGARIDARGSRALLARVLAAPEPEDRRAWHRLVGGVLTPAMAEQLDALKHEIAAQLPARHGIAGWKRDRLDALRAELARRGLGGLVVQRGDEHQGEYVAPYAERLSWLTGFSGSAGVAIVLAERAAIFVDGRYTLQVRSQVDTTAFEPLHLIDEPPGDWLANHVIAGMKIGFDARLHTPEAVARLAAGASRAGASLEPLDDNPVDAIWRDKPPTPIAPILAHDQHFAGRSAAEKREALAEQLRKDKLDAVVITDPSSIAWLLNVRGADVPHTPLPLSFALAHADGTVDWFVEKLKLEPELHRHLGNQVRVMPPQGFAAGLDALGAGKARVRLDAATASVWLEERLRKSGAEIQRGSDPCALPKARKNDTELAGTRTAHRRDAAALAKFFCWFAGAASRGEVDELCAAETLLNFRRQGEHFRDTSFDTIAGAGGNGAIVHYRSSAATNRKPLPGELMLFDSGAQYLDGTTDVTRTLAVGTPSAEQKDRFTRVLKGHIALATARFPKGTTGSQLDALARRPLWEIGLDFDHGTGHGVGSYLSVHEGPHRISKMPNSIALEPGMIVSNEPGYYKTGAYGIRIENLVAVREVTIPGSERVTYGFETLTLCPIDRTLVEPSLMSAAEIDWLDAYHRRVFEAVAPLVDGVTRLWLDEATKPISRN